MDTTIKFVKGGICSPKGFKANGMQCGISHKATAAINVGEPVKPRKIKNDVGIILSDVKCTAAAVYTQNKVKGSPIIITKQHISNGFAQGVIVNSRNANTCNADGEEKALKMCKLLADEAGISESDVIVASTGVIGQPLDVAPIEKNIKELVLGLSDKGSDACATAIMTTDVRKKEYALEFLLSGKTCHLGGIAKGSGMIHPNMATMLCFMTTDAAITTEMLQLALSEVTKVTFNRVSVDGDTSTNDMASIMANGMAGNTIISEQSDDFNNFKEQLFTIMKVLSKDIARDGEGATKLLECVCSTAPDEYTAETVAKSIITSSLFKAAMFGEDANWGRILCAIGYAQAEFDITKVNVEFSSKGGRIAVCKNGSGIDFSEVLASRVLAAEEIQILVELNAGSNSATAWGCDLSYDYVKINGDYRS